MSTTRPAVWVSQPLFDDLLAPLAADCDLRLQPVETDHGADAIAQALRDADGALVTLNDHIDAAAIAQAPRLRAVANVGAGYDNLDVAALTDAGIVATNTPDVLTETTADFGFALLMAAARRIGEAERWLRDGHWQRWSFQSHLGAEIHGSTLGILGMGRIGQAIGRRAQAFGMRVIYHNRRPLDAGAEAAAGAATWVSREALFADSDHLLLALPYAAEHHHLVDAAALARMKPTATLTSIARGGLADEGALAAALADGRLAAAGLDVFEGEPVVDPRLLALSNVVLTPHIASATVGTRRAMVALAVDNLRAALGVGPDAGHPRHRVTPHDMTPRVARVAPDA